ncbi:hypothetical protein PVAP13_8NG285600 [Panicum virgatum]|uniref:Uncharacterized protein n=1 Tax=Panicum virgatum TaxID=38727 RepID=A0A8T0PBK0_PANVG|nr:hypothetical protein PVAP13_8NG285600 [Panicum virgatum]
MSNAVILAWSHPPPSPQSATMMFRCLTPLPPQNRSINYCVKEESLRSPCALGRMFSPH